MFRVYCEESVSGSVLFPRLDDKDCLVIKVSSGDSADETLFISLNEIGMVDRGPSLTRSVHVLVLLE